MRPPDMGDPGGSSSSEPHADKKLQPQVVLYTASASRRRGRTSADLYALRALLRGYDLRMDERDVSTSKAHRCELKSLLAAAGCAFSLPQLLVGGRLVGGPDQVRQLHKVGELQPLLDSAPRPFPAFVCEACRRIDSEPCWRCSRSQNKIPDKVVLFGPTKDVSVGGGGREMEVPFGISLGAMGPLLKKLNIMLGPQGCKLTNRVNDRLLLLNDDLKEISTYLEGLLEVEDPPMAAKCWMKEAHELSYDILDYIDNLVPLELLGCRSICKTSLVKIRKRLKWQKQIEYAAPHVSEHVIPKTICVAVIRAPKRLKWYQQTVEKISEFRIYAQEAVRRYERYQVHYCSIPETQRFLALGPMTPMPPPPCEKTCFGLVIDGRMSKFINLVANDGDQQLKVVSIHGSGCLGKTMLAKVLYNKIKRKFDCRAFIRVSKNPDIKTLLHEMLSQIQQKQPQASQDDFDELRITIEYVRNYLHGRRYLIIVDDLWDTSPWNVISQVFPKGIEGSRIIITTQIEDVALACCCDHPEQVFEMKPLDDDHSRKLFFGRIFGTESDCPEEFKQVSCQLAEICGGLPLATISIASILANQPSLSMDLLTHIHDSLISCLSSNSTSERTRQVLNLCYNSLPHYLKTCLLHLCMYPGGSIIFKHDLVTQWVAERFISAREGQDTEEVAGMYFDQLVDRRFIQPMSINFNNEVVSCMVQDVVHDLIVLKSAEENFIVVVDYNRKIMALSGKVRRLSLQFGGAKYAKIPANIIKSQVRSLGFFGLSECMPCIEEFKLVCVLNLQLSGHRHGEQGPAIELTGISELFHLRYLKIVSDVCVKLPNRIRGLQCLETLDVMDTPIGSYVPWDIIYLPHLLHLRLPVGPNLLYWSVSLDESLFKLEPLQDLYICTPPSQDHHDRIMETLQSLTGRHGNLKTVKAVAHYGGISKASIFHRYHALPIHLQRFEWSPHSSVILSTLPSISGGNLCILKISLKTLTMSCVDTLAGLPALTTLSLYMNEAPNKKIIFEKAGFPALKYFKLRCMSGIAWLIFEAGVMPNLWKLRLVFNAMPRMHQRLPLYSAYPELKQYRHGTALISIEHMSGLGDISAKYGGCAADVEYVSRIGVVCNHPSNPVIHVQVLLLDSGSYGDKRISSSSQESSLRLRVPGVEGGEQQGQDVVSWSNIIGVIGRELFIYCLHSLSRWDYGAIASLNRDFNFVVRNGDIYRLRRKNGVAEHWIYFSSGGSHWHAYDPYKGCWIRVPRPPPPEWLLTVELLAVGTELLYFGMAESFIFRYSILTNSWTIETNGMTTKRFWFGSTSVGEKAYIAGGTGSSGTMALSSAEMYDSETHTWTPLPSMNRARSNCSGVFMDGKFYVMGGHTSDDQLLTCGEEYDLKRQSWRVIDNMSEGVNTNAKFTAPPHIAVVNNELYGANYRESDFKQYDKLNNKWITLGKLPVQADLSADGRDFALRACGDRLIMVAPPSNSTADWLVELHSWIPDEQPPVWNLVAKTKINVYAKGSAVMSC